MLYEYKGLPYNVIPGYPEYPSVEEMLDMSVAGFEPKVDGRYSSSVSRNMAGGIARKLNRNVGNVSPLRNRCESRSQCGWVRRFSKVIGSRFYSDKEDRKYGLRSWESFHPDGEWNLPTYREPPCTVL